MFPLKLSACSPERGGVCNDEFLTRYYGERQEQCVSLSGSESFSCQKMTSNENCRPCQCFKGVPCRFLSCRHECHQIYRQRYFRPLQLLLGALVVVLLFLGFVWAAENQAAVRRFRRTHPGLCLSAILGGAYLLLSVLGGVAVFLFGIAFPILLILIHASVRLRSLKNKLENKLESIGLKRTPMGLLLEALGQEQEAGS